MSKGIPNCPKCGRNMRCTGGDMWYCQNNKCGVGQIRESEIVLELQRKALEASGLTREQVEFAMEPLLSFHERETGEKYHLMWHW